MEAGWIKISERAVSVEVAARPMASRSEILGVTARGLVVALAAPAEKGKANDELRALLARLLGVERSKVEIARGGTSRRKIVRIETPDPKRLAQKLLALRPKAS